MLLLFVDKKVIVIVKKLSCNVQMCHNPAPCTVDADIIPSVVEYCNTHMDLFYESLEFIRLIKSSL